MALRTKVELLENAAVELKVTVAKNDVKAEYDSLLQEYCSKVAVKGFRKGKAPPEVLIRKFGDTLLAETAQKLLEKGLEKAFEKVEHRPLPYSIPKLKDEPQCELEKPFSFVVTYDTFPRVELGLYKDLEILEPVIEIGKEDMDRELAAIQEQNSVVIDKADATVGKDDTVTIDYVELDESAGEVENTKREGFTFSVGSGYNLYKIDDDIIGMKKGGEKVLEKEYPEDFEIGELAGKNIRLKVKITAVKEKKLPELDDELAQDVSDKYKTLQDMKADISKRLEDAAGARIRELNVKQLVEKITADSQVPLPGSMVRQELSLRWQNFVHRFGYDEKMVLQMLAKQGKSQDDLFDEWRPSVENGLMNRLVTNRIGEEEKVEVSEEEMDAEIRKEAENQKRDFDELKSQFVSNDLMDYIKDNKRVEKIHDLLLAGARIKKGKKIKFTEMMQEKD
jgi:trigger factor